MAPSLQGRIEQDHQKIQGIHIYSIQALERRLEGAEAAIEKDWEPNDNLQTYFDWFGAISSGGASCHVYIGSPASVRVCLEEDICEQCGSGTQEVGDWRDCISDCTTLFWAVYVDE